ncbi:hypothetical protein K523DRAFT_412089 [Schizophyllum commune Tattone D]|nr:hypothetical protein K523DRAFT_412089 [Schizophyllum commune Tattone D]
MAAADTLARKLGIQPNFSMDDLRDVYDVLFRLGISEASVILDILDLAGFWLCSTTARSEYLRVMDTNLVYVAVQTPSAPIRAVTFITESHDQGWSSYGPNHIPELLVLANVHASDVRRRHVNTGECRDPELQEWLASLDAGDELRLIACSRYPGWVNHVYEAEVRVYYRCL